MDKMAGLCHLGLPLGMSLFTIVERIKYGGSNVEVHRSSPRKHPQGATLKLVNFNLNKPIFDFNGSFLLVSPHLEFFIRTTFN